MNQIIYIRIIGLFALLFFNTNTIHAQKHDNIWLMGNNFVGAKMTFNNNNLTVDSIVKNIRGARAFTSICDSSGNLLFYTNGIKIHHHQHQLMQNGDGLNPGQVANDNNNTNQGYPISSSFTIIPHPNQAHKYYLIHQSITIASDIAGFGEHLYYSLVDMNANNGLGRVVTKNQIIVSDSICKGQVHAAKHANGRDWWLIQGKGQSRGFYTFLVAGDSITLVHEQYIGNPNRIGNGAEWIGQAVFSPNGDKYIRQDYQNDLDIFDFDRCTGLLSNAVHIPIQDDSDRNQAPTGAAVSPSGQYLYLCSWKRLYQFDLWATNIASTMDTVAFVDTSYNFLFQGNHAHFAHAQLAPDGKIYVVALNTPAISVIAQPDQQGIACDVRQHQIDMGYINGMFSPNHPHYRMPPLVGSPCDTLTSTTAVQGVEDWEINLFPNPTDRILHINSNLALEKETRIEIYNSMGQLVQTKTINTTTDILSIDVSKLIDGMYILRLNNNEKTQTKSFIIAKR